MRFGRLRIAFVADTLFEPIGGGVIAGRNFVERLRVSHEVVVIGADATGPHDVPLPGFQFPLEAMRKMRFVMARPARAAIARAVAGVDVVHLQYPFWLSFATLAEARRAGRPVIAAFHVQPENVFANLGVRSSIAQRALYAFWVRRFYNRVDAVVCPTAFAEKKLRDHGLTAKSVVISNGVPPDIVKAAFTTRSRSTDSYVLLAVGRLSPEKRQDVLIRAVSRSLYRDRIQVVIAGAGPREPALRALARDLGVNATVGYLPRAELRRLFFGADLFVHAGEVELEGISVLEAMTAGLPVVVATSPESAASEWALDARFRFPAGDVDVLADRIDALLAAPETREGAGLLYAERAREFTVTRSVQQLVRLYREVSSIPGADGDVRPPADALARVRAARRPSLER